MKTTKLISMAVCLLTFAGCRAKMIELVTDLPPAKYGRAPQPGRKQGEPFLVPQGTKLLSRGAEVTSSDEEPIIGELEMVTDGKKEDPDWQYFVEVGPGLQWVQLDLGKPHALHAILVWHFYLLGVEDYYPRAEEYYLARVYQDVVVQVSNDPAFEKDVRTVFNNDHDNSSGLGKGKDDTYISTSEGRWIDPKGVEGRYVRLYSRGYESLWHKEGRSGIFRYNEVNHYIEVEVYGK